MQTEREEKKLRDNETIAGLVDTLSERLLRISGISCCNLETRSMICSSVILETPEDCLERDLLLDIIELMQRNAM